MTDKKPNQEENIPAAAEEKDEAPPPPKPPAIKPRKAFVAKKFQAPTDKPMEHKVRHIRLSSKESADLFRQTALDFQNELAALQADNPDKEFEDREKVEALFTRLAKKYSACPSRPMGGDLGWISPGMPRQDNIPPELIKGIMECRKFVIPEPILTPLGYHVVLIYESRVCKMAVEQQDKLDPRYEALAEKDSPLARAPTRGDIPT